MERKQDYALLIIVVNVIKNPRKMRAEQTQVDLIIRMWLPGGRLIHQSPVGGWDGKKLSRRGWN